MATYDHIDATANPMLHFNGLELHDFIDSADLDQYINLIRGEIDRENSAVDQFGICDQHDDLMNIGCGLVDNYDHQIGASGGATPGEMFGFNIGGVTWFDPNSIMNSLMPSFDGEMKADHDHDQDLEDHNDGQDSSATTSGKTTTNRKKVDRSGTLISERRRRGKMKEKLYALRSLVPNITKVHYLPIKLHINLRLHVYIHTHTLTLGANTSNTVKLLTERIYKLNFLCINLE